MQRVGIVVFPGFQILDLVAISVFELANMLAPAPHYTIQVYSEHGGAVASSSGVQVQTQAFDNPAFNTLIVAGGMTPAPASVGLLKFLAQARERSRRTASICTGAFVLAEAGLLDGRRATTHWMYARDLQRAFPAVKVEDDRIFISDGPVWTSAGMTAGIDLSLALVEQDLGVAVSRAVAQKMVVYHRRTGGQSQFSALLELEPKSDRIQSALSYAKRHLQLDLSVEQLATVAHLSPRQFSRIFRSETGQSPARAVEALRVEAARTMLENDHHAIDVVARETGFADPERMRRAFLRAFGQPPQAIKRAAKQQAA